MRESAKTEILEHQQLAGICEHSARLAPILDTGHIFSRVS